MKIRPMLAQSADTGDVRPGFLVSAKLDGIRGVNLDGQMLTRSLKPIPNRHVRDLWSGADLHGLDGEFILGEPTGPDVYRRTNSALMRHEGEPDVVLYLFDDFSQPERPYLERFERLQSRAKALVRAGRKVCVLDQVPVGSQARRDLDQIEERLLADGYEGLIVRDPASAYKFGRSTVREAKLLKIKRFADGEAVILRAVEQMHNQNGATVNELGFTARSSLREGLVPAGVLGAVEVRDIETGVEFSIGSGFTAAQRKALWKTRQALPGQLITYRHFPIGIKDKPRFPTFKGFRSVEDMAA